MPEPARKDLLILDEMARRAQADYLRRSSITFLECAIHLCVTHMSIEEVAALLEQQAQQLREFR